MGCFSVWSQRWDSNPRPAVYETAALPLSYAGVLSMWIIPENIGDEQLDSVISKMCRGV